MPRNFMTYGGRTLGVSPGGWGPSSHDPNDYGWADQIGAGIDRRDAERMSRRSSPSGGGGIDIASIIREALGSGPSVGHQFSDGGMDFGGMRGTAASRGPQMAEYYPMGMIPTSANMEHVSQFANRYRYSDTPDLGKMIRAPWRPETWDPNYDLLPEGGRVPGFSHTGGRRRRRRR